MGGLLFVYYRLLSGKYIDTVDLATVHCGCLTLLYTTIYTYSLYFKYFIRFCSLYSHSNGERGPVVSSLTLLCITASQKLCTVVIIFSSSSTLTTSHHKREDSPFILLYDTYPSTFLFSFCKQPPHPT